MGGRRVARSAEARASRGERAWRRNRLRTKKTQDAFLGGEVCEAGLRVSLLWTANGRKPLGKPQLSPGIDTHTHNTHMRARTPWISTSVPHSDVILVQYIRVEKHLKYPKNSTSPLQNSARSTNMYTREGPTVVS